MVDLETTRVENGVLLLINLIFRELILAFSRIIDPAWTEGPSSDWS